MDAGYEVTISGFNLLRSIWIEIVSKANVGGGGEEVMSS